MKRFSSLLFAVSLLGTVACGGDGFSNADSKLSELDAAGVDQLCSDIQDALDVDEFLEGSARLFCFVTIQLGGEQCVDADLDACTRDFLSEVGGGGITGECQVNGELATDCEATVAELEACVKDTIDVFGDLADASCADLSGGNPFGAPPQSCVALEAACPGVFEAGFDSDE